MGVSVFSGLVTTFIACIALFLTDMLWFRLFGCFIAMVIFSAFFTSMLGLMAMLSLFGTDSPAAEGDDAASEKALEVELTGAPAGKVSSRLAANKRTEV